MPRIGAPLGPLQVHPTHPVVSPTGSTVGWLPVLFAALGWLRASAVMRSIERSAGYIRLIETYLCDSAGPCGWETHLHRDRRPLVTTTIRVFWAVLVLVTLVVPFFRR